MIDRLMSFEGIHNFRDFGGLKTKDNKTIKNNYLYRSARLDGATLKDIALLKELGIDNIIDFRNYSESQEHPNPVIKDVANYNTPAVIEKGSKISPAQLESFFKDNPDAQFSDLMIDMYKKLPFENSAYRLLIEKISQCNNQVILQHCTAGRDRTGVGSAIILLLLNVDREIIEEDYILSNIGLEDFFSTMFEKYPLDDEQFKKLVEIVQLKKSYIQAALDEILLKYDSYDNYLKQEYKLSDTEITKIRDYYTY